MSDVAPPSAATGSHSADTGARWHFRLLGDIVLADGAGRVLRLPSRPATALLARLALLPQRAHAREELVELLWPGIALDVGRNRLRQVLSTLKSLIESPAPNDPLLLADRQHVRLAPGRIDCDVLAFEDAVRGRHVDIARALYRGELMPGYFDDWIAEERLRLTALADRVDVLESPGRDRQAADRHDASTIASSAPAPADRTAEAASSRPTPARLALPRYLTHLHGAETSAARLRDHVRARRLVTLVGPGGQGKTRLAVECARGLDDRFDLIAFVPLVSIDTQEGLLDAMLLALRQQGRPGDATSQLAWLLSERRALLILDNVEQLVEVAAGAIAELLEGTAELHLLVTSRRVLGLDGEVVVQMPSLPLPDIDADGPVLLANPAVALFIDRARAARLDFHLSQRNRDAVVALVRLLQGMPLAIELAASRVRSTPPAQMLEWLRAAHSTAGGEMLQLLARSGPRSGHDARHASMLAVVDWSWRLLTSDARRLLTDISVFAGGFTADAAQRIGPMPPARLAGALDELVAHSMLRHLDDGFRLDVFEVIRMFAASQTTGLEARHHRARHRRCMIAWGLGLSSDAPRQAVRDELPNIVAAFASAAADDAPADAASLAAAVQGPLGDMSLPPGTLRHLAEVAPTMTLEDRAATRGFLTRALLRAADPAAALAMADLAMADLAEVDQALAGADRRLLRAQVLARVAHARWRLRRDAGVAPLLTEAAGLAAAAGDRTLEAGIVATQGAVARPRDRQAAIELQRRALGLWEAAGDVRGMDTGRANLAMALSDRRDGCAEALALLDDLLQSAQRTGDWVQHAHASNIRGEALARQRQWAAAAEAYRDCIRVAYRVPEVVPLGYGLWNLPRMLAHLRQPILAAQVMGFDERFAPQNLAPLSRGDLRDLRRVRRLCLAQCGEAEVSQAWHSGARLTLAEAVRAALTSA